MVIHREKPYENGMNMIVRDAGNAEGMLLDFGILKLAENEIWTDSSNKERAILLIGGNVNYRWDGLERQATRQSCFDENPEALHVPAGKHVELSAGSGGAELGYEACANKRDFQAVYWSKSDIRNDVFGANSLNEASIRTVRTVFDGDNAEFSNMVLGEVINHPGKWSSYPPHDHPHPEIYHYRMFPQQGFGVSFLDYEAETVRDKSTCLISPEKTHPQVAAAGYAMYYIWMIPHLPDNRWLPSTRCFRDEHEWLLEKDAEIWPERSYEEVQ